MTRCDLTVKGLGYYVSKYHDDELCDLISSLINVGGCPSCHSSNHMTSLSIGINAHDQETYDHRLTNELVLIEATRDLV